MFEARLVDGLLLRQVMDAVKDLVRDANMDVTEEELTIQCMDSAHVSLIDVRLSSAAFESYRCDKSQSLGFNCDNITKIMKMMNKDDTVALKAEEDADKLTIMFEDPSNKTIADFGELYIDV
jgi:proliferating cell nuclear antigen